MDDTSFSNLIKGFWELEDFKSTKYNFIVLHIVMLLIGYMYFQLYKNTETKEGQKYAKKSLLVAIRKYVCKKRKDCIVLVAKKFNYSLILF
ncbi:hypothetical protein [Caloranaerobacter azorensis]|uniref:Uncharacterized protein n=1 Tax=Caloranaerobacter azorensis TaxID=116090 RepID=A0A6P1YD15_9FIRM|nr:hypothetical protein [Caloranaerobacter azorensis]QIB25936.1 hypothetical protein G3A45_00560 [Caloranaerobacter azorensis]